MTEVHWKWIIAIFFDINYEWICGGRNSFPNIKEYRVKFKASE